MNTHADPLSQLTSAQCQNFDRDGCLVLRQVVAPSSLAAVRQALETEVERNLATLVAEKLIPSARPELPFTTRFISAGEHSLRFGRSWTDKLAGPAVYALHHDGGLLGAIASLLPGTICGHRQFNARPKLPGQDLTVVPWHQDTGYYGKHTAGDRILTAWMPLVPVDGQNGCMQVALGSHRQGWVEHVPADDAGGFLRTVQDPDPASVVTMAMQPGDVLIMHNLVLHRSTPNVSQGIRWSVDLRFYAEGTPSQADLLWGFPAPWVLTGNNPTPLATWQQWYGK